LRWRTSRFPSRTRAGSDQFMKAHTLRHPEVPQSPDDPTGVNAFDLARDGRE
jgi:hypothetical protein